MGVVTLADVMNRGLYYQEVQQLARDHGLPVSRTKDELVDELIQSDELDPEEVVAYVGVDMLRTFLQEMGLPSGASRAVLADRLVEALGPPAPSKTRRRKAPPRTAPTSAGVEQRSRPEAAPRSPPASGESSNRGSVEPAKEPPPPPINLHFSSPAGPPPTIQVFPPPNPPPTIQVLVPRPERPSAAWGFAGILMAAVVGAALYLGVASEGVIRGAIEAIIVGALLAFGLLIAARWWVPWVDGIAR